LNLYNLTNVRNVLLPIR